MLNYFQGAAGNARKEADAKKDTAGTVDSPPAAAAAAVANQGTASAPADEGKNGTKSADAAYQLPGGQKNYDRVMSKPLGDRAAELAAIKAEILEAELELNID